jgi:ribosomal subunit interface protein
MNITIKSVNFSAGATLQNYIRQKVSKLFNPSSNIIRAEITLRKEKSRKLLNKICEIKLMVPGYDHFAKNNTGEFNSSILETVRTLQKTLRSAKTKQLSKRQLNIYDQVSFSKLLNK